MEYKENQSANIEQEDNKIKPIDQHLDIDAIQEVEAEKTDIIDFESYNFKKVKIADVKVIRIKSNFANAEDGLQNKIKIISEVVEVVKDKDGNDIEIRASELMNCVEDAEGNFKGLSNSEKSQWTRLKKALKVTKLSEIIGKELPMRIIETKTGSKFLGLLY